MVVLVVEAFICERARCGTQLLNNHNNYSGFGGSYLGNIQKTKLIFIPLYHYIISKRCCMQVSRKTERCNSLIGQMN